MFPQAAGAAAVAGAPLSEVAAIAQRVADSMATLGVALKVCTLPGKPAGDRWALGSSGRACVMQALGREEGSLLKNWAVVSSQSAH